MSELIVQFSGLVSVFVYGTLKPGEANYQKYCADKVVDAQRATAQGQLFALPMGYPAMTLGYDQVHGYLLSFADLGVLHDLDDLEDYQPARQVSENLYNRQQIEVFNLQKISLAWAWVYLMTPDRVSKIGGVRQPDGWWSGCGLTVSS
ncbi:gamma-glutamylcyclotransferase [Calothrix sp. PCC 7507]|uniref:gamma-glutamylcyclotransferase family protein n=1 Tax=Calothrix sp. PCC 7507 TaxID=99598 RepID=UPI00029F3DFE|nr:gamma-glutamylcyclotransferase [Calothrix sp. PCC 7507]AFY36149.1 AIG2 family protein [Calothrix sp. PCC 7507]